MLTMRRTVADGRQDVHRRGRPRAGSARPSRHCRVVILSTLKRMLAASRLGSTSRLASPVRVESGQEAAADGSGQRGIAMHLAVAFRSRGRARTNRSRACAHLRVPTAGSDDAEAGVRQEGHLRRHAEALHLLGRHQGDLGQLLGAGLLVDVGVGDEQRGARAASARSSRRKAWRRALRPMMLCDVLEVGVVAADQAAHHGVGVAELDQQRGDHGVGAAHRRLGRPRA